MLTGPIGTYTLKKQFGLGMGLSAVLISLGSLIRFLAGNNYGLALLGNGLMALSQSFAYPSPSTLSSRFFNTNEETIVMS